MPQYKPIGEALSRSLDAQADAYYAQGQNAAGTGDDYVRVTLVLASVLFLLGISTQFASRGVRYGLLSTGALLLLLAAEQILAAGPALTLEPETHAGAGAAFAERSCMRSAMNMTTTAIPTPMNVKSTRRPSAA